MAALIPLFRQASRAALPASDRELLTRFAAGRDEDAFAELVRRHGPVVYRICRRLVGPAGADDAFQAAFLVLATRLDAARAVGSLGGWLVGVAGRVARQMRRAAIRRARHESLAADARRYEPAANALDLADQFRVLDEELARLPDRLRDPVVLCLLQGRTQDEAAAELGRDARTLRRRLERAKQVLRARLERRGIVPAVATALVAAAGSVSASVPHQLNSRTVSTVFNFLTGGVGASSSAPVVLAKGVATTMFARKLMHLMAALAAGLVGFGVVLADDGPPLPTPATPVVLPVVAAPSLPTKNDEARLKAHAKALAGIAAKGKRMILIEAICMDVPAGFCEESGLEEKATAWTLSPREARMFNALIRAQKEKGAIDIISQPQLVVQDNQTGFAQVGQDFPYVASAEMKGKNGKIVKEAKIAYQPVGVTLKARPRISADGKSILLGVTMECCDVSPKPVDLGNGLTSPAFNNEIVTMNVLIPDTGTVVLCSNAGIKPTHRKILERVWVLTTHIVKGNGKVVPPRAKPPVPVAPPITAPVEPASAVLPETNPRILNPFGATPPVVAPPFLPATAAPKELPDPRR